MKIIPIKDGLFAFGETKTDPRNTQYHRKITHIKPIPGTKSGHYVWLDCGHQYRTFGGLADSEGVLLCQHCMAGSGE